MPAWVCPHAHAGFPSSRAGPLAVDPLSIYIPRSLWSRLFHKISKQPGMPAVHPPAKTKICDEEEINTLRELYADC